MLFKGLPKDKTNADIGWMKNNRSPFYRIGYRLAAEKLSNGFGQLPVNEKDALIFPIIYLYRHHIELAVKEMIEDLRTLTTSTTTKDLGHHKILDLWDELTTRYLMLNKTIDSNYSFVTHKDLTRAREVIKELSSADSLSFSFRYAKDKQGNMELGDIEVISLSNFTCEIEAVLLVLDNLIETISHQLDLKSY